MAVTPQKAKDAPPAPPQAGKSGSPEIFRNLLRQADKQMKEGDFEGATATIANARSIDPGNPFIRAFEERLNIFKDKSSPAAAAPLAPARPEPPKAAPLEQAPAGPDNVDREMLEQQLRRELEGEYKERFTAELRKAEEHAAKIVQDERANIELHREALRTKFEHQLSEIKDQLERDYLRKLKAAAAQSEALMEKQYQESLSKAQQDLATKLSATHENEQKRLQEQIQREKSSLESREQAAFGERERLLRETFERELAEKLKHTEAAVRAEGEEQRRAEIQNVESRLSAEFESRLAAETETWKKALEAEKAKLLEAHAGQERALTETQQAAARKHEESLLERERQVREELTRQMEENLRQVRDAVKGESEQQRRLEVEQRQKSLAAEFESRLAAETQKWKQELESQRRELQASYEEERKKLSEVHRTELEEHERHRADLEEVRKHLAAEFEARLAADQDRRAKDYEAQLRTLGESHEQERRRLAEAQLRELESIEAKRAEQERALRAELERAMADAIRDAREAARGESTQKLRAELEETQNKLTAEFNAKLAKEREALSAEHDAQAKELERTHAEHEKKLTASHRKELDKLEQQHKTQEAAALRAREESLRKEFETQLAEALKRAEQSVRTQSEQAHRSEADQLRAALTGEFEHRLAKEREDWKREFDAQKHAIELAFTEKRAALAEAHRKELEEQEASLRAAEDARFRKQQEVLRKELEAEFHGKFQAELEAERQKVEQAASGTMNIERERLQKSYDALLASQDEKLRSLRSTLQREMEETFIRRMEQFSKEYDYKMELMGTKVPTETSEKHALYRKRMRQLYANGDPTVAAAKDILALKEVLELTFDEHLMIEADVRLELYTEEVERLIVGNEINLRDTSALSAVKDKFRITPEESAKLEPYILSTIERLAVKGRVLVADDDILLLQTLDELLTGAGFQVIPAVSVNEGLVHLNTTSVDLILSDIKFGESELDGFQFFAAVQAQPQLRKIPFIFMSALRDGVIVRSGVQLGVDDYLTKPVDPDLLVAVIEGKLKRYRLFEGS
jgi:CheY-like chemotaxis protein